MTDIRLHIGGVEVKEGWSILNIQPGPGVDYVGNCTDLSAIPDAACSEVYTSHTLEHLGYNGELQRALKEINRVMKPGARLRISVPDLDILCRMFLFPDLKPDERFEVMRMMFGGRVDAHDIHGVGLNLPILSGFLMGAGFHNVERVADFHLFKDTSSFLFGGHPVSLNVRAWKPAV
jgi:predicted SAM-dependent methyltransferase